MGGKKRRHQNVRQEAGLLHVQEHISWENLVLATEVMQKTSPCFLIYTLIFHQVL